MQEVYRGWSKIHAWQGDEGVGVGRKKANCDTVVTEVSTDPTGSSRARVAPGLS